MFVHSCLRFLGLLIAVTAFLLPAKQGGAQSIEADLGTHKVAVEVDFAGTSVLLFGSILDEKTGNSFTEPPDIIIAVRGPERTVKVRRKSRKYGIWVNADSTSFDAVPGYYALVTNKPISDIASSYVLRENKIGFNSLQSKLLLSSAGFSNLSSRDYAAALVRNMKHEDLYQEHIGDVSFPGKHLFRAEFSLPSNVPLGKYTANIFVFKDGNMVDQFETNLKIEKAGIERFIFKLAHEWPLLYGILAVLLAVIAGMGAAAIFGKK